MLIGIALLIAGCFAQQQADAANSDQVIVDGRVKVDIQLEVWIPVKVKIIQCPVIYTTVVTFFNRCPNIIYSRFNRYTKIPPQKTIFIAA